jgi:hypothetical protein
MNNKNLHPLIVLSTAGHNGVDWLHSLLDSHAELLILPAFSFFRTLNYIRDKSRFKNLQNSSPATLAKSLVCTLSLPSYQGNRRRLFVPEIQGDAFASHIEHYLKELKIEKFENRIFYSLHYAYARLNNINLNQIKTIVVHEHVPWHSLDYLRNFSARFLFIIRDPRAALAGAWIRQRRPNSGEMDSYRFDHTILYPRYFLWFQRYLKVKGKDISALQYAISNEKMHENLSCEMRKLATWIGIEYSESLLRQTFAGRTWFGESVYLAVDDLSAPPPSDYYEPANIESRWRNALSTLEIKMIEWLTRDIFTNFGYKCDPPNEGVHLLRILMKLFFGYNKEFYARGAMFAAIRKPRDFARRLFVIFWPNYAPKLFRIP